MKLITKRSTLFRDAQDSKEKLPKMAICYTTLISIIYSKQIFIIMFVIIPKFTINVK